MVNVLGINSQVLNPSSLTDIEQKTLNSDLREDATIAVNILLNIGLHEENQSCYLPKHSGTTARILNPCSIKLANTLTAALCG